MLKIICIWNLLLFYMIAILFPWEFNYFLMIISYNAFFIKALSKQLRKLTIKTKRLTQLKLLSLLNIMIND